MPKPKKANDSPSVQEAVSHEETPLSAEKEAVTPTPDPVVPQRIEFIIEDF